MNDMHGTADVGALVRDSSLLTTAERNAILDGPRLAARRRSAQAMQARLDLLDAQIHNAARRRLEAWADAAQREIGVGHVTAPLAERLEDLFDNKRRLLDPRMT